MMHRHARFVSTALPPGSYDTATAAGGDEPLQLAQAHKPDGLLVAVRRQPATAARGTEGER